MAKEGGENCETIETTMSMIVEMGPVNVLMQPDSTIYMWKLALVLIGFLGQNTQPAGMWVCVFCV